MTPSKIGGKPVWLSPENTPSEACRECKANLVFLGQVYCDLAKYSGMKRMLYLFVCGSEKCVQLGRAFAYRCMIPEKNDIQEFASDADYEEIQGHNYEKLMYTGKFGPWYEELEAT